MMRAHTAGLRAAPPARTRRVGALCLAAALALGALGCPSPRTPEGKTVSLRMRGTPPNAIVTVDDRIVGPLSLVAARGVALPPGTHRVSVEAAGHFPHDVIVEAKDEAIELEIRLEPIPD